MGNVPPGIADRLMMGNKAEAVRQRIIEKADELFYRHGFEKTSFSDIASALNISRGNFYYHYKSKDDILQEVIQARMAGIQQLLDGCEHDSEDASRAIRCFIELMTRNRDNIQHYGCPAGTLCLELSKLQHAMRDNANDVFRLLRQWLARQFHRLGKPHSDRLAMHLLTRIQGLSTMMTTFNDAEYYHTEIEALYDWLDSL